MQVAIGLFVDAYRAAVALNLISQTRGGQANMDGLFPIWQVDQVVRFSRLSGLSQVGEPPQRAMQKLLHHLEA